MPHKDTHKKHDPEYDELMERVDKHLEEDFYETMSENLKYKMGLVYPMPPLWLAIVIVIFFAVVGYLMFHPEVWLPSGENI